MIEFTLEIWDEIRGGWCAVDSSTTEDGIEFDYKNAEGPWRVIKSEIVAKSDRQPIGG